MSSSVRNRYTPETVSAPGETLAEVLESRGMTQAELARRAGTTPKNVNEIIAGKAPITPSTALRLERVLGIPASFWNAREGHYREALARAAEQGRLQTHAGWLKQIPVREMVRLGWIRPFRDKVRQLQEVLDFFGVASPERWKDWADNLQVQFRISTAFESDLGALAAWLRNGQLDSQQIACEPYDAGRFREALRQIRSLTVNPPDVFQKEVSRMCAAAGVAVVFVPELPRIRASGAARWVTPSKALIQLSLRYKTDDHLWFSFFHEAGHILLHGKREMFLDNLLARGKDTSGTNVTEEAQANRFAADTLIPPRELEHFLCSGLFSEQAIGRFAARLGIASGIVVGRLQHDHVLKYSACSTLKLHFAWSGRPEDSGH